MDIVKRYTATSEPSLMDDYCTVFEDKNGEYVLFTDYESLRAQLSKPQPTSQDAERLQAKIDALMFEYCPNEMTQEQIAAFEKHQVLVRTYGL